MAQTGALALLLDDEPPLPPEALEVAPALAPDDESLPPELPPRDPPLAVRLLALVVPPLDEVFPDVPPPACVLLAPSLPPRPELALDDDEVPDADPPVEP